MNPDSVDFHFILPNTLNCDPDTSDTWFRRGEVLAQLGRYREALASFEQAIALQPDHQPAWLFRGVMLIYLERYPVALESCDRAVALCPTDAEAWLFRGVALHRLQRYAEAYASYDQAAGKQRQPLWQQGLQGLTGAWLRLRRSRLHP